MHKNGLEDKAVLASVWCNKAPAKPVPLIYVSVIQIVVDVNWVYFFEVSTPSKSRISSNSGDETPDTGERLVWVQQTTATAVSISILQIHINRMTDQMVTIFRLYNFSPEWTRDKNLENKECFINGLLCTAFSVNFH